MTEEDSNQEPNFEEALSQYLKVVRKKVENQLSELEKNGRIKTDEITVIELVDAINAVAKEYPTNDHSEAPKNRWYARFFDSPVTVYSFILTVVFGGLGLWAATLGDSAAIDGQAFLDIAKIFAGAIVGSAAATATYRKQLPDTDTNRKQLPGIESLPQ